MFYRNIDNLKILSGGKDLALTSFRNYNANIKQHLSNEEFEALKNRSVNCNFISQKADKGNSVVLVKKNVYIRHM